MLSSVTTGAAAAFPRQENQCSDDTIQFTLTNQGGEWDPDLKAAAIEGILDWNNVLDWDGGKVVNSLAEGGTDVKVRLDTTPGGDANKIGYAECIGQATIQLNPNKLTTEAQMEHSARHEMGHLMGLEHTGSTDGFGGDSETMATCGAPRISLDLNQDDYGNITHKKGDLNPRTLHGNQGFEQGTSWWGTSDVASFSISTSDPADGAAAVNWRPNSTSSYFFQTMNYSAAGGKKIDARTNHKKISSNATTGTVDLQILVREVDYGEGTSCAYPSGKNQNVRDYVGPVWGIVRTQIAQTSTSWQILTEGTLYTIPSDWEGVDVRVRVKSSVKYSDGSFALLKADTTRVRDRS